MDKSSTKEVKSCSKCGEKKTKVEQEKCSTCKKAKQKIMPTVIFSLVFFALAVYGTIIFVKDIIELFSK